MSLPINISTYVTYGKVCAYLAANDFARQKALKGRFFNTNLPQKIDVATNILEWANNQNPNDPTLVSVGNYAFQLFSRYVAQAQYIISGNGTGVIVNPATGVISTIQAVYAEFIVGVTPSPAIINGVSVPLPSNGDASWVLGLSNIMNGSIAIAKDGVPLPTSVNDRYSFTPVYTPSAVTININNGNTFATNDLFVVTGLQYVSI